MGKPSESIRLAGVIDRDFKAEILDSTNCIVLPYHEVESCLSHPQLIFKLQRELSNVNKFHTVSELVNILVEEAKKSLLSVSLQRTFKRLTINLSVSMTRKSLAQIEELPTALEELKRSALGESHKAVSLSDQASVEQVFMEEHERCAGALACKNIEKILLLFEGKPLFSRVFKLAGCGTPLGAVRALSKHVSVSEIPFLDELKTRLEGALFS